MTCPKIRTYKLLVMRRCLFVCLVGVLRPTRKIFTHLETSPWPVKGCKFWHLLGIHGHWAVRVFFSVPHLLSHGTSIIMLVSEDPRHSLKIILKNHWANSNITYRFRHLIIVIVMFLSLLWLRKCGFFLSELFFMWAIWSIGLWFHFGNA